MSTRTLPDVARIVCTVAEAADRLGISTDKVRTCIADGTLPAYRVGTGPRAPIRIKITDVDALLRPIAAADSTAEWV
ncbi:excisionase family DNA-binding protein [Rhodococcus zopfii]